MRQFPSTTDRAKSLVNTSVQDLMSSLVHYKGIDPSDVEVVKKGLKICVERGEKTKAVALRRKLKKMEKEKIRAVYLALLEEVHNASV